MSARCLVRGSLNVDEFFHVENIVRPGETVSSTKYERRAGGKGANQACAIAMAEGIVLLAGTVGLDGEWMIQQLHEYGVQVSPVAVDDTMPTGRAIIQIDSRGENSIVLVKGANFQKNLLHYNPEDLFKQLSVTHLLLQNEIEWESTLAYLNAAAPRGITTIFNPSPIPTAQQILEFPWHHLTWLLTNETETQDCQKIFSDASARSPSARQFNLTIPNVSLRSPVNPLPPRVQGALDVALSLRVHLPRNLSLNHICTIGADGVLAILPAPTQSPQDSADLVVAYRPAVKAQARDTTGAGDCFAGYFIAGLMKVYERRSSFGITSRNGNDKEIGKEGMTRDPGGPGQLISMTAEEIDQILEVAIQAAGLSVERMGAMESYPTLAEVTHRLELQS